AMRAIVINGKEDLTLAELPVPEPGPGQVRIRTAYVGICGSDLHYYYEGANGAFVIREPLVPGHEMSGTVDADPSGTFAPGTPVTVHPATFGETLPYLADAPHLWPNGAYLGSASTWPHTQGAAAEYFLVDAAMVRALPEGLPLQRAALAEPLAVGLHGIALAGGGADHRGLGTGAGARGRLTAAAAVALGAAGVTSTDAAGGTAVAAGGAGRAAGGGAARHRAGRRGGRPAGAGDRRGRDRAAHRCRCGSARRRGGDQHRRARRTTGPRAGARCGAHRGRDRTGAARRGVRRGHRKSVG